LAQALVTFGVPEEILTDNGKQFTDRFGKGGEVLFDKFCRKNGIKHRLTAPASPNQNGKVERFHGTFRPDFLDQAELGAGPGGGRRVGGRVQHRPSPSGLGRLRSRPRSGSSRSPPPSGA